VPRPRPTYFKDTLGDIEDGAGKLEDGRLMVRVRGIRFEKLGRARAEIVVERDRRRAGTRLRWSILRLVMGFPIWEMLNVICDDDDLFWEIWTIAQMIQGITGRNKRVFQKGNVNQRFKSLMCDKVYGVVSPQRLKKRKRCKSRLRVKQ